MISRRTYDAVTGAVTSESPRAASTLPSNDMPAPGAFTPPPFAPTNPAFAFQAGVQTGDSHDAPFDKGGDRPGLGPVPANIAGESGDFIPEGSGATFAPSSADPHDAYPPGSATTPGPLSASGGAVFARPR